MELIDKAALVAEIKKLIRENELYLFDNASDAVRLQKTGAYSVLNDLLHFIDTLEVKEVQEEPVSEDLKEAADKALESISDQYDIISVGSCLEMFRLGAEWQREQEYTCYEEAFEDGAKWKKEKTIDKACKWIDENAAKYLVDRFVGSTRVVGIDTSITEDFRKDMED